jgi:galactokinase
MQDAPQETCAGRSADHSAIDPAIALDELARRVERDFRGRFGRAPQWLAAAPGRVNLIGEHTDYNDGFVLPMAIERYVVMAAAPAGERGACGDGKSVSLSSSAVAQPERFTVGEDDFRQLAPWARYVYGVMVGCRAQGLDPPALDMLIHSTVPLGGGLSSSAALEVATATLLEAVTGQSLDPIVKALLCQKAEHQYAGVPCGIMDQFTSVLGQSGHLLLLDCRSTQVQMVPLSDPEVEVLIINTNVKHELTGGEYAQRRSQCEAAARAMGVVSLREATLDTLHAYAGMLEPVLQRRARHVIGENDRTTKAAACLSRGQWAEVGRLMYASHASLRDDYEVSCEELDVLVELAQQRGGDGAVIGSRMTGGGFGGCTVSLVRKDHLDQLAASIASDYQRLTGVAPTMFTTRPAQGAQILRV